MEAKRMKTIGLLFAMLLCSAASFAQLARPTVYIEPQSGFETYLAAAISKKGVPVDVVTDQTKATYLLKAAPVEIRRNPREGKSRVAYSLTALGLRTRETCLFS